MMVFSLYPHALKGGRITAYPFSRFSFNIVLLNYKNRWFLFEEVFFLTAEKIYPIE